MWAAFILFWLGFALCGSSNPFIGFVIVIIALIIGFNDNSHMDNRN